VVVASAPARPSRRQTIPRPGFFIVGAPKCGTTALSEYLRAHPSVFMSTPKEPHFFCSDFDYYFRPGRATLGDYLHLFDDATPAHLAIGEASVWYLYSQAAVPAILEFDPGARIVVMVRDPVELVPSLHSQLRYSLDEDEDDVERAWRLQDARERGERVPRTCRVPEFLQYRRAAALGAQVERLMSVAPRGQVHVVVFDDLRADPRRVYADALAFLGVPDDGRTEFPRVNANKAHRGGRVARLTQRPPRPLVKAVAGVKRAAGVERIGVLSRIRQGNRQAVDRPALRPEFAEELAGYFAEDVAMLAELIGRDLSAWGRSPARV